MKALSMRAAVACSVTMALHLPAGAPFRVPSHLEAQTRDSAGIQIVANPSPVWRDGRGWSIDPVPVLQIGSSDGSDAYGFSRIESAVLLPRGEVAIVDGLTREIRVFGPGGTHKVTMGGQGEGPGEFGGRPILAFRSPDSLLAWDPQKRRLVWFGLGGELRREVSLDDSFSRVGFRRRGGGSYWWLRPDGVLLTTDPRHEGVGDRGRFILLPFVFDGRAGRVAALPRLPAEDLRISPRRNVVHKLSARWFLTIGDDPAPVSITRPFRWEIWQFGLDGTLRRIIRADIPSLAVTEEVEDRERRRLLDLFGYERRDIGRVFADLAKPDSLSRIGAIHEGEGGELWVGRRTFENAVPRTYDVVDRSGRWLGSVPMPVKYGKILDIGTGLILAAWRDELDVPYIRVYRLNKGG